MDIGNNLRNFRIAQNKKAVDLAELLGVSATTYNRIETNQSNLDANLLPQLAEFFGKTINEMYGIDDKNVLNNPTQHIKDSATGIIAQEYHDSMPLTTNEQNPLERIIAAKDATITAQQQTITAQTSQIEALQMEVARLRG